MLSCLVSPYFKAKLQGLYTTALQEAKSEAQWDDCIVFYMCFKIHFLPNCYWPWKFFTIIVGNVCYAVSQKPLQFIVLFHPYTYHYLPLLQQSKELSWDLS